MVAHIQLYMPSSVELVEEQHREPGLLDEVTAMASSSKDMAPLGSVLQQLHESALMSPKQHDDKSNNLNKKKKTPDMDTQMDEPKKSKKKKSKKALLPSWAF